MTTPDAQHTPEFGKQLEQHTTNIPGLTLYDIPVHGDNRGWFKENWQREKMTALGLPDFGPVQNNVSFNASVGTTRGIHAEPWDKFVSVATGRVFGAWVDLREGDTFGQTFTAEIDPSKAIFVPRGVGNAFQTLEPNTAYSYLVNDHWTPDGEYAFLNLADETVAIDWPIPLDSVERSPKDIEHPRLDAVTPVKPRKVLITGANGQLGRALRSLYPEGEFVDRTTLDVSDTSTWGDRNWRDYETIINAAAYTKVDAGETPEGRIEAWKGNVTAAQNLARVALENNITLVHVSSDYVFDGTNEIHTEDELFSPLGVYGQTKAAGDVIVSTVPKHYILRTSWVFGDGANFVRGMRDAAAAEKSLPIVDDQFGRLTSTEDLAKAIKHLLDTRPEYGTYNLSNEGETQSWQQIAQKVYEFTGHDPSLIGSQSTEQFAAFKASQGVQVSPRPRNSTLGLDKIKATGFTPRTQEEALRDYLA